MSHEVLSLSITVLSLIGSILVIVSAVRNRAKLKAIEAELSKFATSEFSEAKILIARIRAVL